MQRPRRDPFGPPDDARPDDERGPVPALPGRGQGHRGSVRDVPRRGPHRAAPLAPGDDPARDRRGPPDPPLERGGDRAPRRTPGQPVRRRARRAAPDPVARGHRAVLRGGCLDRAGDPRDPAPRADRRGRRRRGRDQARHAARHRDPVEGPWRAPPASGVDARRSPRHRERRGSDEADEAPARAARGLREGVGRGGLRPRRASREAGSGLTEAGPLAGSGPVAGIDLEAIAGPGTWLELSVAADHEAVEAVSEILSRAARGGTSVEPAFELVDEGLGARVDVTRPAIVRAALPLTDATAARAAVDRAERELGHLQAFGLRPIGELTARVVHENDWANAWKAHFPVLRVGRRIVIRPTWRRHRRQPDDVVLALDPGMAFGTGLHPTTRLCLAALEELADRGMVGGSRRVLDVGCGSGILAIAAGLLGAREVLAVDVDPIAVDATRTNARRNRLDGVIATRQQSVPTGDGPFDLVLANLIAGLLVTLADALAAEVRPGGTLLASGIFHDREPQVVEAYAARGLRLANRWTEGDWVALELVRPA